MESSVPGYYNMIFIRLIRRVKKTSGSLHIQGRKIFPLLRLSYSQG